MPKVSFTRAAQEVARRDRVIRQFMKRAGRFRLAVPRIDHFNALVESILYQQLAGAAAAAIHRRFIALFDGHPSPQELLDVSDDALRSAGISQNKALAMRDLATKVLDGTVPLEAIERLKDENIIERLITVRGIGRWTAEMFLIFQLRRLNVWPVDDYGVRKGYALLYGLPELPKPKELSALGERFHPYRTVAAWYCWRAVDTVLPGKA
ncbi:MAG TPA: DNA-3-methyladenine glycosylase 2 family protein [Actinomycetota bacterium]|nr:DNA-3-methyladenine glycosylase 2 family protein [Actinomycetota bacterium]